MARGRMIARTIATDKALNSLTVLAEYYYLKTIPHLDRDGLIVGDPLLLAAMVTPRRPELTEKINGFIDEWQWTDPPLVIAYQGKEDVVLYFLGFVKNQRIRYEREAPSRYEPPPGFIRTNSGLIPDPDQLPTNSRPTPDKGGTKSPININSKEKILSPKQQQQQPCVYTEEEDAKTPKNAAAAAAADSDFKNIVQTYENNIGMLTSIIRDELLEAQRNYPHDWLIDAILEGGRHHAKSWPYIERILERWAREGRTQKENKIKTNNETPEGFIRFEDGSYGCPDPDAVPSHVIPPTGFKRLSDGTITNRV